MRRDIWRCCVEERGVLARKTRCDERCEPYVSCLMEGSSPATKAVKTVPWTKVVCFLDFWLLDVMSNALLLTRSLCFILPGADQNIRVWYGPYIWAYGFEAFPKTLRFRPVSLRAGMEKIFKSLLNSILAVLFTELGNGLNFTNLTNCVEGDL